MRLINCRMPKEGAVIEPGEEVLDELERRTRNRAASARESQRAKLVLLYLDGVSKSEISRRLDLSRMRVIDWIKRFEAEGLAGLEEREGRGRKESYTAAQRKRIVDTVCRKPKKGLSRWSIRTLARHLGFPPFLSS